MADHSKWMGDLHDMIKDTPLCQLPIPGSHDGGTYGTYDSSGVAQTQSLTITQQLQLGIRYFDLRVRCRDQSFYIHHGIVGTDNHFAPGPAGPGILTEVALFVAAHRQEVVILDCWDMDDGPEGSGFDSDTERNEAFEHLVKGLLVGHLITRGADGPEETVGDLLGRGQVIFMTDWSPGATGDPIWSLHRDLIDYYDPPKISATPGVTSDDIESLLAGLKSALQLKRRPSKFYKYQAIFNYDPVFIASFESMMQYGAWILNPIAVAEFRDLVVEAIAGGSTVPNIIIMDFVEFGSVVDTIVDAITYNWTDRGTHGPAIPLEWNSNSQDGWLLQSVPRQFEGGYVHAPEKYLVGLWVRAQDGYGIIDVAEVYADHLGAGVNPTPQPQAPAGLDWHYGGLSEEEADQELLVTVPDKQHIVALGIVNDVADGIVNLRVRSSNGSMSAGVMPNGPTTGWVDGPLLANQTVSAVETGYESHMGVTNLRYATRTYSP